MSWVPGPTKNIYKKESIKFDIRQAKACTEDHASEGGAEGEEGEWTSVGVPGSPDPSSSSSLGRSKLKSRPE